MAEIIMLIIFLLLLAFSTLLDRAKKENAAQAALIQMDKGYVERIVRVFSSQPPDMTEEIISTIERLPEVINRIKEQELAKDGNEPIEEVVMRGLEKIQAEKEARDAMGDAPVEQQLLAALAKQKELEAEARNLSDQKKSLISQIESKGRGVDWPPCWPDSTGKGAEFLFKIDLTNDGIVMFDNAPEHRAEEKARLPMQNIKYGVPRNIGQFQAETAPLFNWSKQKECRFYVLIYDKTGASEKALFKRLLITVEGSFYKKLVTTATQEQAEKPQPKEEDKSFFGNLFGGGNKKPKKDTYN
jgi:hypothetical protein